MRNIFANKLFVITGGSSGIGQALARNLIQNGANVYIVARKLENLTETILQLKSLRINANQEIGLISTDVTNDKDVAKIMTQFCNKVGTPDYLINSAGIVYPGIITDLSMDIYRDIMDVNFFGIVNVVKALLPGMIARGTGHIINISSFVGFFASYGYSAYAASKFAVRGFSDVLRAEVKPLGINVSVVFPADTDTPQLAFERNLQPVLMRQINSSAGQMSSDKVAKAILKGIAHKTYSITPGFEATLAFWITNIAGYLQRPILDSTIANAQKKVNQKTIAKS
jgi:3-dehydrosphinganine reductase